MSKIHSTAIIGDNCTFGKDVVIGAYSIIDENVKIGNGTICLLYTSPSPRDRG